MFFDTYKFRASQLPALMTGTSGLTDKQLEELFTLENKETLTEKQEIRLAELIDKRDNPVLSETVKTLLKEIWIQEKYNRKQIIVSKYLEKGTNQEPESISLYRKATQEFCQKNEERFESEFLCGTPDLIIADKVVDIKTSWNIWTFAKSDQDSAKKDYYYQLLAYMILTGKTKSQLAYCLINNSEYTIYQEVQKIKFAYGLSDEKDGQQLDEIENQINLNNTYDDIPVQERVKIFEFELDPDEVTKVETQLKACREYLNSLTTL